MKLGASLKLGYFAQQALDLLDPDLTVWEQIQSDFPRETVGALRGLLGAFQFSGDEVEKRVRSLSGGEKSRLVMARMLYDPPNFLVLDEPTNHLDLATKEMLIEALRDFEGTMLFVSHDRTFLRGPREPRARAGRGERHGGAAAPLPRLLRRVRGPDRARGARRARLALRAPREARAARWTPRTPISTPISMRYSSVPARISRQGGVPAGALLPEDHRLADPRRDEGHALRAPAPSLLGGGGREELDAVAHQLVHGVSGRVDVEAVLAPQRGRFEVARHELPARHVADSVGQGRGEGLRGFLGGGAQGADEKQGRGQSETHPGSVTCFRGRPSSAGAHVNGITGKA